MNKNINPPPQLLLCIRRKGVFPPRMRRGLKGGANNNVMMRCTIIQNVFPAKGLLAGRRIDSPYPNSEA